MSNAKEIHYTLRTMFADILHEPLFGHAGARQPVAPNAPISSDLHEYIEAHRHCSVCALHINRTKAVFGNGNPHAKIVCVGDYPSIEDDKKGAPFSDAAGDLLHKMIVAMKLKPEELFYVNLVACRSKGAPLDQEIEACRSHLEHQLHSVNPSVILAFGQITARHFARSDSPLAGLRKQEFSWGKARVFCTHHPRELLSSPALKKEAWDDLQRVMLALKVKVL